MGFRNVHISQNVKLSLKNSNLQLSRQGEELSIPINDINTLVIEDNRNYLSSRLISELAENKVAVMICDDKHLPTSVLLPFQNHTRQRKRIDQQFGLSKPFKNNLWKNIVSSKILNQAITLEQRGFLAESIHVKNLLNYLKSGDRTNIEGRVASIYFITLFGKKFTRDQDIFMNACLNYTYAIVRASLARHISAYGLIPSIGIFHKNEYNNFNLADDLIEPFRPLIDLYIIENTKVICGSELNSLVKKELLNVLHSKVILGDKNMPMYSAIEQIVKSFVTCLTTKKSKSIVLPMSIKYYG